MQPSIVQLADDLCNKLAVDLIHHSMCGKMQQKLGGETCKEKRIYCRLIVIRQIQPNGKLSEKDLLQMKKGSNE